MRRDLSLLALTAIAIFACGCTSVGRRQSQPTYRTRYYDRNRDGVVDLETHHAIGVADADWQLSDTDFDGRYDEKTSLGWGTRRKVDQSVPTMSDLPGPQNTWANVEPD